MGLINEELTNEIASTELCIVEHDNDEMNEPWKFISIKTDYFDDISPEELKELGKWLINQGNRLGEEYKSNGTKNNKKL